MDHKQLDKKVITACLAGIIWDYNVDLDELYEVLTRQRSKAGPFTLERLLVRMLERLSWYELLDALGLEYLRQNLTGEIIAKIRFKTLRGRYERISRFLSGHPVSLSGWDPEYREEVKHTLLSHRWHRAQQTLF
jgi:hypothetical protein